MMPAWPMNKKYALIAGVITFVIALLAMAPATLLSGWILQRTGQQVLLANAEGTIWNGTATVVIQSSQTKPALDNNEASITAGKLRWEIFPLQLALGRIYAALYWNNAPPAWLSVDSSRIHLEHALLDIPASIVSQLAPAMRSAGLDGQLNLRTESLSLTEKSIQGDVLLDWMQASSPLSAIKPLGNYHAQISGNQDSLSILLSTLNGALMLNGSGSWSNQQGLNFQGTAQAETGKEQALSELLRVMGNEQVPGSGMFQISVQAR